MVALRIQHFRKLRLSDNLVVGSSLENEARVQMDSLV